MKGLPSYRWLFFVVFWRVNGFVTLHVTQENESAHWWGPLTIDHPPTAAFRFFLTSRKITQRLPTPFFLEFFHLFENSFDNIMLFCAGYLPGVRLSFKLQLEIGCAPGSIEPGKFGKGSFAVA